MTALFSSPKVATVAPIPPAPIASDPAATAAAQEQATAAAQAAGRASTILTSGQGDTSQARVAKKTLLGG
ncbi:MAG TPA: hypothetical protein VGV37_02535 [Aliidongia sp.]|uniref:hypothetical protein n=1 Tax=Aliidongia sp. TaxID=1914230 RepID=UPI002DDCD694|nr:hypothetical protein [Aliidongia sp.]HEV2673388.1 hypothetical protein [Aliidongia sp.]